MSATSRSRAMAMISAYRPSDWSAIVTHTVSASACVESATLVLLRHPREVGSPNRAHLGVETRRLAFRRRHGAPQTVERLLRRCAALRGGKLIAHALQVALAFLTLRFTGRELLSQRLLRAIERHLKLRGTRLGGRELNAQAIDLGCRRRGRARGRQLPAQPVALRSRGILGCAHRFVCMLDLARQQPIDAVHAAAQEQYEHDDDGR